MFRHICIKEQTFRAALSQLWQGGAGRTATSALMRPSSIPLRMARKFEPPPDRNTARRALFALKSGTGGLTAAAALHECLAPGLRTR